MKRAGRQVGHFVHSGQRRAHFIENKLWSLWKGHNFAVTVHIKAVFSCINYLILISQNLLHVWIDWTNKLIDCSVYTGKLIESSAWNSYTTTGINLGHQGGKKGTGEGAREGKKGAAPFYFCLTGTLVYDVGTVNSKTHVCIVWIRLAVWSHLMKIKSQSQVGTNSVRHLSGCHTFIQVIIYPCI